MCVIEINAGCLLVCLAFPCASTTIIAHWQRDAVWIAADSKLSTNGNSNSDMAQSACDTSVRQTVLRMFADSLRLGADHGRLSINDLAISALVSGKSLEDGIDRFNQAMLSAATEAASDVIHAEFPGEYRRGAPRRSPSLRLCWMAGRWQSSPDAIRAYRNKTGRFSGKVTIPGKGSPDTILLGVQVISIGCLRAVALSEKKSGRSLICWRIIIQIEISTNPSLVGGPSPCSASTPVRIWD